MRTLILSNFSDKIADLNALTAPNKQAYADRHGYVFENINHPYEKHVEWLEIVRDRVGKYDCVLTIGCDAIFTNMARKVEEMLPWQIVDTPGPCQSISRSSVFDSRVIIARENISWWPINNDVMIWPNAHCTINLLEKLIEDAPIWLKYPWLWQAHLWDLIQGQYKPIVRIVEARTMNSTFQPAITVNGQIQRIPGPSSWQLGDWILHALDMPHEMRLAVIKWGLQFVGDGLYGALPPELISKKN